VTALDGIVIIWVALWALYGTARGLVEQLLSLAGLVAGALAGSRIAPHLLPDGRDSIWLPLVALGGAVVGAAIVQALLLTLARPLRRRVERGRARRFDQGGGLVLGGALGLTLAWLIAAVAIYQPGDRAAGFRDEVQRSSILGAGLRAVPPDRVLGALVRIDPFPLLPLPTAILPPPDPSLLRAPGARRAEGSVVELRGRACGLVKQGSGWVAADGLVATNAHVIAGQQETEVLVPGRLPLVGRAVYVDAHDDVALLRVRGLGVPALRLGDAPGGPESVVLLGYPRGGPLVAESATASAPRTILAPDAYGRGRAPRSVVVTRGSLGPGSSGGPVVDRSGTVVGMIFGGTPDDRSGAAVPPGEILDGLRSPLAPVSSGPCS
jgi:S1-C subfamily serine protease